MKEIDKTSLWAPALSLLTSLGTLVCCALPALLVTLGMGAVLAGLVSAVPQLVWLSAHKAIVFTIAGGILIFSGILQWKNRRAPCPADPAQAAACRRLRAVSWWIWALSVVFYITGFFFAFIAVKILY